MIGNRHKLEDIFKSWTRAMRFACAIDAQLNAPPASTKPGEARLTAKPHSNVPCARSNRHKLAVIFKCQAQATRFACWIAAQLNEQPPSTKLGTARLTANPCPNFLCDRSNRHKVEALFKCRARAKRSACSIDAQLNEQLPSTNPGKARLTAKPHSNVLCARSSCHKLAAILNCQAQATRSDYSIDAHLNERLPSAKGLL